MKQQTFRTCVVGLLAAVLALGVTTAATAASKTVRDERGPRLQAPANQLLRGTLTYTAKKTVFRARIQNVKKNRTRVFAHIYYPDDSALVVSSYYRRSGRNVTRAEHLGSGSRSQPVRVRSRWNLKRDVVRIVIDNTRHDPKPRNRRAVLTVFTVTKGRMHGPLCPWDPRTNRLERCNDDSVSAQLGRRLR